MSEFASTKQILQRYPQLHKSTLMAWAAKGWVATKPGARPGWRLYSLDNVEKVVKWRLLEDPGDRFIENGETWLSLPSVQEAHSRFRDSNIHHWRKKGCRALKGKRLELKVLTFLGLPSRRSYIRESDRDAIVEHESIDDAKYGTADEVMKDYGISRNMLRRGGGRGHRLLGRKIKTKQMVRFKNDQYYPMKGYLRVDVQELASRVKQARRRRRNQK